jgi:hypothetical protein
MNLDGRTAMDEQARVESSKFDLGSRPITIDSGELPWGYGENRITALVRDPDSAYLYWEVTDDGIAGARSRLGPAGAAGWCNLRVYDTTGRDFDGTNANDYFDIRVERTDREYFLMIRRPSSTMHVEIGIKTSEGYFQPITRSGRAEFPRNTPSPDTALQWLTVATPETPPAAAPYRTRYRGPEPQLPAREGAGYVDVWRAAYAPSEAAHSAQQRPPWSGVTQRRFEKSAHIERWWHLGEWRAEWRGGLRFSFSEGNLDDIQRMSWHEGPFPVALLDPERIAFELLGEVPARLMAEGTQLTVYGPWKVTIRGFEQEPQRRTLGTWSMHWVVATTPMIERWGFTVDRMRIAGYERHEVVLGASEQRVLLERGASEVWRLGASERLWLGASERALGGGSETLFLGATQFAFLGASALLYGGASERIGASELWRASGAALEWGGASERRGAREWLGGSEWLGASEWLGGSEWLGASERLGGSEGIGGVAGNVAAQGSGGGTAPWAGGAYEKWASRPTEGSDGRGNGGR